MSTKPKKATQLSKVTVPQSHTRTYKVTPFDDDSGRDNFYDLTLSTLSYLISETSSKHDLNSNKDAVVLYVKEITKIDCRKFTSEAFVESLTKNSTGDVKIYKHFAFAPNYSDLLPTTTLEEVEIFHVLTNTAKDLDQYEKDAKSYENSPIKGKLDTIKKVFDKHEDRRMIITALAEKINFLTPFYSVGKVCPPMTYCEIKWPNAGNKQYGIMEKVGTKSLYEESTYDDTVGLKEKLELVKKLLGPRVKQISSTVKKDALAQKSEQLAPTETTGLPDPTDFLNELEQQDIAASAEQSMQEILNQTDSDSMVALLPGGNNNG